MSSIPFYLLLLEGDVVSREMDLHSQLGRSRCSLDELLYHTDLVRLVWGDRCLWKLLCGDISEHDKIREERLSSGYEIKIVTVISQN
jgi:hypothetical protein